MPTGNNLAIAKGAADGVNSFIQSFIAVSQMKNQTRLQKNAHVENVLLEQIRDPDTKFYQRAKLIDAVGNLYDHPNLSGTLGYDKLNEQDVADPNQPAIQGKEDILPVAPTRIDATGNIDLTKGTATEGQIGTPNIPQGLTKRGNLTPNDIAFQQKRKLDQITTEDNITQAKRIAQINFDLQERSAKATGFNQEVSRGILPDGRYSVTYKNLSGEQKTITMPAGFKPEKIQIADINASKPTGKVGQLIQMHQLVSDFENGTGTVTKPEYDAAKESLARFEKTGKLIDSQITANTQRVTGTVPIQPAQSADDERADKQNRLILQKAYDDAYSNAIKSSAEAKQFADEAHNHYLNIVTPAKDQLDKWLAENGGAKADTTDTDFIKLNNSYKAAVNQYNSLKTKADAAAAKDAGNKKLLEGADKRLNGNSGIAPTKKVSSNITPRMKAMIAAVRKDPKNVAAVNMSDDEIAAQIIASGHK